MNYNSPHSRKASILFFITSFAFKMVFCVKSKLILQFSRVLSIDPLLIDIFRMMSSSQRHYPNSLKRDVEDYHHTYLKERSANYVSTIVRDYAYVILMKHTFSHFYDLWKSFDCFMRCNKFYYKNMAQSITHFTNYIYILLFYKLCTHTIHTYIYIM